MMKQNQYGEKRDYWRMGIFLFIGFILIVLGISSIIISYHNARPLILIVMLSLSLTILWISIITIKNTEEEKRFRYFLVKVGLIFLIYDCLFFVLILKIFGPIIVIVILITTGILFFLITIFIKNEEYGNLILLRELLMLLFLIILFSIFLPFMEFII